MQLGLHPEDTEGPHTPEAGAKHATLRCLDGERNQEEASSEDTGRTMCRARNFTQNWSWVGAKYATLKCPGGDLEKHLSNVNSLHRQLAERGAGALLLARVLHTGVLGPPPFCAVTPPTLVREYLFLVAVGTGSLWVASPGVLSQHPLTPGRFSGRHPSDWSTIARCRRPLTHGPRREVVSGPAHPTASGRLEGVALFKQTALLSCGS